MPTRRTISHTTRALAASAIFVSLQANAQTRTPNQIEPHTEALCEGWNPPDGFIGITNTSDMVTWDPDGDGPIPSRAIAPADSNTMAGDITGVGLTVWWDGENWFNMPAPAELKSFTTYGITFFQGQPVAYGVTSKSTGTGSTQAGWVARWDGFRWVLISDQFDKTVWNAAEYAGVLYVSGEFQNVNGQANAGFAAWDGTSWGPVPGGPSRPSDIGVALNKLLVLKSKTLWMFDGKNWTFRDVDYPESRFEYGSIIAHGSDIFVKGYSPSLMGQSCNTMRNVAPSRPGYKDVCFSQNAGDLYYIPDPHYDEVFGFTWGAWWDIPLAKLGTAGWEPLDLGFKCVRGPMYSQNARILGRANDNVRILPSTYAQFDDGTKIWAGRGLRLTADGSLTPLGRHGLNNAAYGLFKVGPDIVAKGSFTAASGLFANGVAVRRGREWVVTDPVSPGLFVEGPPDLQAASPWMIANYFPAFGSGGYRTRFWNGTAWEDVPFTFNSISMGSTLTENQGKPVALRIGGPLAPNATYDNGTWIEGPASIPPPDTRKLLRGIEYQVVASTQGTTTSRLQARQPDNSWIDVYTLLGNWSIASAQPEYLLLGCYPKTSSDTNSTFDSNGELAIGVARWDGDHLLAMGDGLVGSINRATTFEGELVVAGKLTASGDRQLGGLARWDGQAWQTFGDLKDMFLIDLLADGNQLHVAGSITLSDGKRSSYFNTFSRNLPPTLLSSPSDLQLPGRAMAIFEARADGPALTYQWFRDGQPLVDGLSPSGARVYGSREARLRIEVLHQNDAGIYTCSITNACGQLQSAPASLRVCSADLNTDNTVSFEDFLLFFNLFDQSQSNADLNGDTQVDLFDFLLFFNSFDRGC
jgi:hypothetical protein